MLRNMIMNLVIRPPRMTYNISDLGDKEIKGNNNCVISTREDFQVATSRGYKMECSFFPINNTI